MTLSASAHLMKSTPMRGFFLPVRPKRVIRKYCSLLRVQTRFGQAQTQTPQPSLYRKLFALADAHAAADAAAGIELRFCHAHDAEIMHADFAAVIRTATFRVPEASKPAPRAL